ncbi:MAG: hypothetical protein Q8873_02000 [Bacillota bacterium]|nr:hypothetical protein [Bacillota bacterium]
MKYTDFYRQIYKILGRLTPLDVDCGKLCDGACCKGDDETGMYLFPGEKHMYAGEKNWLQIEKSDFEYDGRHADILICTTACRRERRPLACRIFPLLPYVTKEGELEIIFDPRGKYLCPLAKAMYIEDLNPQFVRKVKKVGQIMMKIPGMRKYLTELSRIADEYIL